MGGQPRLSNQMFGVLFCICIVSISTAVTVTAVCLWLSFSQASLQRGANNPDVNEVELRHVIAQYLTRARDYGQRLESGSTRLWNAASEAKGIPPELMQAIVEIRDAARVLSETLASFDSLKPAEQASGPERPERLPPTELSHTLTRQELITLTPEATVIPKKQCPSQRYQFMGILQAAPWSLDEHFPASLAFQRVKCRDLSAEGISFLWPDRPDFERFVVAIGTADAPIYMAVEIVHSKAVFMFGEVGFLIGGKFIKRITPPHLEVKCALETT
jgi:hypothetical protein